MSVSCIQFICSLWLKIRPSLDRLLTLKAYFRWVDRETSFFTNKLIYNLETIKITMCASLYESSLFFYKIWIFCCLSSKNKMKYCLIRLFLFLLLWRYRSHHKHEQLGYNRTYYPYIKGTERTYINNFIYKHIYISKYYR